MKQFEVEVTETLQRTVFIEAENEQSAFEKVKELYRTETIVLSSADYIDTKIDVIES